MKIQRLATILLALLMLSCLSYFVIMFFNPCLLEKLRPRPMFRKWVGGERTCWSPPQYMYDDNGARIYYDEELTIMVVLWAKDPTDPVGLVRSGSTKSTFEIKGNEITVSPEDHERFVIVGTDGLKHEIPLARSQGKALWDKLRNSWASEARPSGGLRELVGKLYEGEDAPALLDALKGQE
jgi:hypothetical protein